MNKEEIEEYITNKLTKVKKKYPYVEFGDIEIIQRDREGTSFYFKVGSTINIDEEILMKKIHTKKLEPYIGLELDLSYYTDDYIKHTINKTFNQFSIWLNNLEIMLKKKEEKNKRSGYVI